MDRRGYLVAVLGTSGLAGCTGLTGRFTDTPTPTSTSAGGPTLAEQGFPADICAQEVVDDRIKAITNPTFADTWSGVAVDERYTEDAGLADETVVIGVVRSIPRAYPLPILWHHEIVNDRFPKPGTETRTVGNNSESGALPLLVTYCPICRSGMVAERRVDGEPTVFDVSGQLWRPPGLYTRASEAGNRTFGAARGNASGDLRVRNSGNLVMVDEATGSFWSQVLARAICGPRTGDELRIVPSTLTTWGDWQTTHEDTEVLLPPPHSGLREQ